MSSRAAITVNRPREEVVEAWNSPERRPAYIQESDAAVEFRDAPGDRGTEIHVDLDRERRGGRLAAIAGKLKRTESLAKVKDELRRFKQLLETGEIPRSDGTPGGESVESKLGQRPAQPLSERELADVRS